MKDGITLTGELRMEPTLVQLRIDEKYATLGENPVSVEMAAVMRFIPGYEEIFKSWLSRIEALEAEVERSGRRSVAGEKET